MDRREVSRTFRARLTEVLGRSGSSRSALARRVGIDRSTLTQLLSEDMDRLPRADTIAAVAAEFQVSLDWLLGLSHVDKLGADIIHESLQIAESARTPVDEQLVSWFEEAAGYKVRYVPTTVPDLAKTEEVLRHEYRHFETRGPDRAISASRDKLEHFRLPETDMEICMSRQALEAFAGGAGIWCTLKTSARVQQLDRLIEVVEELYPSLRMYLFDGLTHYSAPYTIFGHQRAALYVGQFYLVFNTTEHISVLNGHFDRLIRAAVIQPTELVPFLSELRDGLVELGGSQEAARVA